MGKQSKFMFLFKEVRDEHGVNKLRLVEDCPIRHTVGREGEGEASCVWQCSM